MVAQPNRVVDRIPSQVSPDKENRSASTTAEPQPSQAPPTEPGNVAGTLGHHAMETPAAHPPIGPQAPHRVSARLMENLEPERSSLFVSLSNQRAYLMRDEEIVIDTPISSGKRTAMTPAGEFQVLEKVPEYLSRRYGNFVDDTGRIVRAAASAEVDAAPSGTRFTEAPARYFLRLSEDGAGIHAGHLPGYPAADRSIRLPEEIAEMIFHMVQSGTPVTVAR